jgi:hypothetical protein
VTRDDFLSVSQVAAQYPQFRGGERSLLPGQQPLLRHSGDCIGYDLAMTPPQSARFATYTMGYGDSHFSGHSSMYSGVYLFRSRRAAGRAFDELLAATRHCWGRHVTSGGFGKSLSELRMPRAGHESFAYRLTVHDPDIGKDLFVQTWVRKGRYLVNVAVERDRKAPAAKPAYRLSRTAARIAG